MRMKNFNLTPRVKKVLENAQLDAEQAKHERVNCAHLFKALFKINYPLFDSIFKPYKIDYINLSQNIIPFVEENHPEFFKKKNREKLWHNEVQEIVKFANQISEELNQEYIGIEHFLYALLTTSPTIRGYLDYKKVPYENIAESLISHLKPQPKEDVEVEEREMSESIETKEENKTRYIEKYCTNLNALAMTDRVNNVFGRDKEIEALIETVLRKTKNNVILIGDPGVGKTAIVEGLASKIVNEQVTYLLGGRIVVSLNVASMVAGTKYRGQFEQRFQGLLDELKKDKRYILFIDEIHTVIGAGSGEGSLDVANMIKPSLARGEICCIGATTHAEYKKYFEKDGALKRRFEAINIDEPTKEQTKQIMMSSKKGFEEFHEVSFSEEMINNLIYLCDKYMPYRKFPDKAFDILDTISSRVKIKNFKMPQSLVSLEKKIKRDLEKMDSQAVRDRCEDMIASYSEKLFEWSKKEKKAVAITLDDLITVFADKLKINKNKIVIAQNSEDEEISKVMKENVFGQDEAMEKLSDILICARAGLKDKKKPLAKFLFIGPTGVGKTWTAKLLAEKFFGNEKLLLKLDMSEYQEASSINKLIGSAIGYIGCEEGGVLTEFVRNHPNCVVLFDEIEKANREINSILLQIMDDGYVTDSLGRRIDFTNTIIILTGNIGQEESAMKPSMGFNSVVEKQEDVYKKAVEKFFKPEFLGRLDEVIPFKKISNKEFHKILETMIGKTKALLLEQGRTIEIEEGIFDLLLKIIEKEGSNARAIQKIYRKNFEINLAKFLCQDKSPIISAKINQSEVIFQAA